jgi:hypothetical protein
MKRLTMNDFDDGYGMSPAVFGFLAECVNSLLDCDDFELSEIGNRADYRRGALVTLYSQRFEYAIEVDGDTSPESVALSVVPLDQSDPVTMFRGIAAQETSWRQVATLILVNEDSGLRSARATR